MLHEALLTGSHADIAAGMNAVLADTSVDDTARRFAKYYNGRDKADASAQQRDVGFIKDSCGR